MNRKIICLMLAFVTVTRQQDICLESCDKCLQTGKSCETCSYKRSPLECNSKGDLICGVCRCNDGYDGGTCQIHDTEKRSTNPCIQPNTSAVCSGRGECVYGICECNSRRSNSAQKYSGRFCQCDDYSCMYSGGQLCGGPERGNCECYKCRCRPGYRGEACGCKTSNETCIARNGLICNGHGNCLCGKCQCHKSSDFRGPTCEDCSICMEVCYELLPCVQCKIWKNGPYDYQTCENMCDTGEQYFEQVDQLQADLKKCKFEAEDHCLYTFGYFYSELNQIIVQAQRVAECRSPDVVVPLSDANIITQCTRLNFFILIVQLIYFIFTI